MRNDKTSIWDYLTAKAVAIVLQGAWSRWDDRKMKEMLGNEWENYEKYLEHRKEERSGKHNEREHSTSSRS